MADQLAGFLRASLGQGLGMGWGDELEANYLSDLPYEQALKKIRQEYAQYSKDSPVVSTAAEFVGGMAPAVGMMFVPGAQAAGAAQAARSTGGALARLAGLGAATGAVSGAGSATEDGRASGATSGGLLGGTLGLAVPVGMRSVTGGAKWLRERLAPSEAGIASRAGKKLSSAIKESNLTPQQIEQMMARDRSMGVPSTLANTDAALADLAEAVAQRTGKGTRKVEKTLTQQKAGSRERAYQQVAKGLKPGNYYDDEARMVQDLRSKASTMYDEAYAWGDVDDPKILQIMQTPEVQGAFETARSIANAQASLAKIRGEDPSKFAMPEIYKPTGKFTDSGSEILELTTLPDVRTLDFMKRGLDAQIKAGYKSDNAAVLANISTIKEIRNDLRDRLKDLVPPYKKALSEYSGDMEVIDAMRAGLSDFGKLDSEQVVKMVAGMSKAEKEAFRTGVARNLYGKVMDPSTNFNAASRIINSPETVAKMQPLFDDPAHFRLFQTAMERESQLYQQANKILGGSQTAKRSAMSDALDEGPGVGEAVANAVTGGFWPSLTSMAARVARSSTITPQVADKLSDMLMSKNPAEVASVVKFLEQYEKGLAPKAVRSTAAERGAVMGSTSTVWPAPQVESGQRGGMGGDIEQDIQTDEAFPASASGPDIEADIEADLKPK
jgi:hypothetical protein